MLVVSSFEVKKTLKTKLYYKLVLYHQLQLPLCEWVSVTFAKNRLELAWWLTGGITRLWTTKAASGEPPKESERMLEKGSSSQSCESTNQPAPWSSGSISTPRSSSCANYSRCVFNPRVVNEHQTKALSKPMRECPLHNCQPAVMLKLTCSAGPPDKGI